MRTSLERKTAAIMLVLSGAVNVYALGYVIWIWSDLLLELSSGYLDLIDFWIPVAGCVVSLTLVTLALLAMLRRRNWWLAVIGSVIAPLGPIVWQLFPVTRDPAVVVPRTAGVLIGLLAVVLVLISKRDFDKRVIH